MISPFSYLQASPNLGPSSSFAHLPNEALTLWVDSQSYFCSWTPSDLAQAGVLTVAATLSFLFFRSVSSCQNKIDRCLEELESLKNKIDAMSQVAFEGEKDTSSNMHFIANRLAEIRQQVYVFSKKALPDLEFLVKMSSAQGRDLQSLFYEIEKTK